MTKHEETVPAGEVRYVPILKHLHPFARCPTVSITIITTITIIIMIINNFSFPARPNRYKGVSQGAYAEHLNKHWWPIGYLKQLIQLHHIVSLPQLYEETRAKKRELFIQKKGEKKK